MQRLGKVLGCIVLAIVYWLVLREIEGIRSWPDLPGWWRQLFPTQLSAAVAWYEFLRLALVILLSIPVAIAIRLLLPRCTIVFALGVGALCAVLLKAVVIMNFFLHSDIAFKVMVSVEVASLLLVLPLLLWGLSVLPSNISLQADRER